MLVGCTLLSQSCRAQRLATTFVFLLAARFALGLSEGPIVPISQAIIVDTSRPKWRGFNMGFMQMVGAFGIAGFLGPRVATSSGRRTAGARRCSCRSSPASSSPR